MRVYVRMSLVLGITLFFLPAVGRAQTACDALLPDGIGLEKDLAGMAKSELESMLTHVQQKQAELAAFRDTAKQTITDLGGVNGEGGEIAQNKDDMKFLRDMTLHQLKKDISAKHENESAAQIASAVQNLTTRFDTDQEFRRNKMTNAYQIIRRKIADGSATERMKQTFETLCNQYADLTAWESGVAEQETKLASAKAVLDPDCWSALQRKFAVAITRLQAAMNESAALDLSGVNGMVKKVEAAHAEAAEDMRATLRYLEVQDAEARGLLLQFEAHMKAMAGKWQPVSADLQKELEKFAKRIDRGTVIHYNTLVQFMELAEETATASYWQQQLKDRKLPADLLEDYASAKRLFSEAQHNGAADDRPHPFSGHDAFKKFATEGEGKNDATGRAVRDLLGAP